MKMNRLLSTLLTLILLACLSGVQGQYATPVNGSSTTASTTQSTSQYAQFYTALTDSVPSAHVLPPVQFNLTDKTPASVYFGIQMQQVPYSTYQPTASGNALWIQGATDWSQYAAVPQGTMASLLAISPNGGNGNLILVDSNGQNNTNSYFFYPTSQLGFYADAPGRHTLSFIVGGVTSNSVIIDVSGTLTMTYPPSANNPVKSLVSYPGYNVPFDSNAPQAALDNVAANKANQKQFGNTNNGNPFAWDYGTYQWMNSP
jgi:hypothetical protein